MFSPAWAVVHKCPLFEPIFFLAGGVNAWAGVLYLSCVYLAVPMAPEKTIDSYQIPLLL